MDTYPITAKAIVTYPPEGTNVNWQIKDINLREPKADELLVRMVATGICHTDLARSMFPPEYVPYPIVLGHEGAGVVEKVGSEISHVSKGDFVLLSYDYCGSCPNCKTERQSRCGTFSPVNVFGFPDFLKIENSTSAAGRYFGQSSFSSVALVQGTSAVNVSGLVKDEEELKKFAPFGCGFQTGTGAVTEFANAGENDQVAVFGLGGVGLLALMAAKMRGCRTIIGVDRVQSRLDLAKRFGATHVVNTAEFKDLSGDLTKALLDITGDWGTSINIDTTGVEGILDAGVKSLAAGGQLVLIGITQAQMTIDMSDILGKGKMIKGCIMGNSLPKKNIPELIQWYRDGKLPTDELIKNYPVEDFQKALQDMHSGATVKPVLIW